MTSPHASLPEVTPGPLPDGPKSIPLSIFKNSELMTESDKDQQDSASQIVDDSGHQVSPACSLPPCHQHLEESPCPLPSTPPGAPAFDNAAIFRGLFQSLGADSLDTLWYAMRLIGDPTAWSLTAAEFERRALQYHQTNPEMREDNTDSPASSLSQYDLPFKDGFVPLSILASAASIIDDRAALYRGLFEDAGAESLAAAWQAWSFLRNPTAWPRMAAEHELRQDNQDKEKESARKVEEELKAVREERARLEVQAAKEREWRAKRMQALKETLAELRKRDLLIQLVREGERELEVLQRELEEHKLAAKLKKTTM
ncbi:hypothetical protein IAT38_001327 [Cryptococcus sp. DSM 104549]